MSDLLLVTLGLLAAVVGCLSKPCRPAQWTNVKAPRVVLQPLAEPDVEAVGQLERISEPGFADGIRAVA